MSQTHYRDWQRKQYPGSEGHAHSAGRLLLRVAIALVAAALLVGAGWLGVSVWG